MNKHDEPIDIEGKELALRPQADLQKVEPQRELDIGASLQHIIASGVTPDNAAAVEKLLDVYLKVEDRNAEKAFNADFLLLQQELPKVKAVKPVPGRDGTVRFTFAPFDEIDDQARPLCLKHGFTYTFSEGDEKAGKVTKICILSHKNGHSRRNSYSVRIGHGPPGCTESQADGSAHSYAKRGALCDALNIRIDKAIETDPRQEGGCVSAEQAKELDRRVKETNSNVEAFLRFAGADMKAQNRFATIPASRYQECDAQLRKKEQA